MRKSLIILAVALSLFAGALLSLQPSTPAGAQNTDCYQMQGGSKWVCDNGGEMEFQTGSTLDVQAGATFLVDDLTLTDLATMADLSVSEQLTVVDVVATQQTVIVVSNGSTITPTGFTTWLSSTANTGTSAVAGCTSATNGRLLMAQNRAATTITITDTSTNKLAGNLALGQFDTGLLQCDGTNWVELARANN